MTPLNFFIKPLTTEQAIQTKRAHLSRGLAWIMTAPSEQAVNRSTLDTAYLFGLASQLPVFKFQADQFPLCRISTETILSIALMHWKLPLDRLNTHWISLELRQFDKQDQIDILTTTEYILLTHLNKHLSTTERNSIMQTTDKLPHDVVLRLQTSLAALEQSLISKDPMMPQHLRQIHSLVISYPESVHLLTDAEIASIIDGAEVHCKTEIVKSVATSKATGGSRKKVSADDL